MSALTADRHTSLLHCTTRREAKFRQALVVSKSSKLKSIKGSEGGLRILDRFKLHKSRSSWLFNTLSSSLIKSWLRVWLDVKRAAQRCTLVLYVLSGVGIIIENIWQGILRLFPQIELFVFLGYLNQLEKSASVYLIAFQTLWKEKLFMNPPPLWKFVSFRSPTPRKFRDPPWGGGGVWIFSGTTHCRGSLLSRR